jgi:hypothetical protein
LPAARYGIISGAKNAVTTVILTAVLLSSLERFDWERDVSNSGERKSVSRDPAHSRWPQYLYVDAAIEDIFMDSRRLQRCSSAS